MKRVGRRVQPAAAGLVALIVLLQAAGVVAQDSERSRSAAARALFQQGLELVEAGAWAAAAERFERAHTLRASPVIAYNLASAWGHLGRLVAATELLEATLHQDVSDERLEALLRERLANFRPQLARLTIRLEGAQDVRVVLDGQELDTARLGVALPVDPGLRRVEARRGEHTVAAERVDLAPGGARQVTLRVAFAPALAITPEVPSSAVPSSAVPSLLMVPEVTTSADAPKRLVERWWFWTLVGVVVVGATVSVAVAGRGGSSTDAFQDSLGSVTVP